MIRQGDKCWVRSGLTKHYAICTGHSPSGRPCFVHNTPAGGVEHVLEETFAKGRPIYIEQRAQPGQEESVAARALALVGRQYDLLGFNCEHVANFAANGRAESGQVRRALVSVAGAVVVALLNQNGTSVDESGYRRDRYGRFASRRWW